MEKMNQNNNNEKKFTATKMSLPVVYNKEDGQPYVMRMYRDGSYVLLRNGHKPMFTKHPSEDMPIEENLAFLGWVGVEIGLLGLRYWMDDLCSALPVMTVQHVKDAFEDLETAGVVFKRSNKHPLVKFSVYEHLVKGKMVCCFITTEDSDVWLNVTSEGSLNMDAVTMFFHMMIRKGLCKDFRFEVDGGDEKLGHQIRQQLDEEYGINN